MDQPLPRPPPPRTLSLIQRSPIAQQFTVQVYDGEWQQLKSALCFHCDEAFDILDHPEAGYHPQTGLDHPETPHDPNTYIL